MIVVERFWQGDRNARMRLDNGPWTFEKIWKQGGNARLPGCSIAVATGGAFIFYFRDAPTLPPSSSTGDAPARRLRLPRRLHGHHLHARRHRARAGLHLYVPVAAHPGRDVRRESLLISYRGYRGEPRGAAQEGGRAGKAAATASTARPASRSARWASTSATASQLECIQCALCIDACDDIMAADRPAARADRLRHLPQSRRRLPSRARAAARRAPAHHPLCRADRAWSVRSCSAPGSTARCWT